MEIETDFWTVVKKDDFTLDDLNEAQLKANLSDGWDEAGFFRNVTYKSIASIFWTENDLNLDGVQQVVVFTLLQNCKNTMILF